MNNKIPPVTQGLMMACAALWLITLMGWMPARVALYPLGGGFQPWQLATYMFMHASWEHIIFNMFTLWMFGRFIESDLGSKRFFLYYMVCGVGAGAIQLLVCYLTGSDAATVGASGAIYGLLLAFGMLHPNDIIMPLIPPIPMKAKWAILVFCGIELFLGVRGSLFSADNVAHFAHLGGALWGFLLLTFWRAQTKNRTNRWRAN